MTKALPTGLSPRKALVLVRPEEAPTLQNVIDMIRGDRLLSAARRRDLASAVRRVAAACDCSPSELVADPALLRQKISDRSPMRLGPTAKTRANILSNAVAALARAGAAKRRPVITRSAEWQQLWESLGTSARIALGSFTRFCSFHEISPNDVSDRVAAADFANLIERSSLRKKPAEAIRDLTVHWNRSIDVVPGWPKHRLVPISAHLLRDCAATTIATDDPEHVHIIAPILGHTTLRTSEKHYNHARQLQANRRMQACIRQMRNLRRPINRRSVV